MNPNEKEPGQDFKMENKYAREIFRIFDLLKQKMSEEEAIQIVARLEEYAKENDEVVRKILNNPEVKERYDVDAYDGTELRQRPPHNEIIHFVRDGLYLLRDLNRSNVFANVFWEMDGSFKEDEFFEWFNGHLHFNKLRIEQLKTTGDLRITDPTKAYVKKKLMERENDEFQKEKPQEETGH